MTAQTLDTAAPIPGAPDAPSEPDPSHKGRPEAAGVQRPDQGDQSGARETPKHSTGGEGAAGAGGPGGFGN